MGLGGIIKDILDPGDLIGGLSGKTGAEAAGEAADITNEELRRQFAISQENLRPFLESAQRQLPGIQEQITPEGFLETTGALQPEIAKFLAPVGGRKTQAAQRQLELAGLGDLGGAATEAGAIDQTTINDLLLGAEADLFGRRTAIAGVGEGAGTALSELGQRTGSGIAQSNIDAQIAAQQAKAAGQQNVAGLASLGIAAFSDERLKENIEELGVYKGLRIIRWDWKDFVPESWKGVNIGFSAQDVIRKYPQYVNNSRGFLSIEKENLLRHLETL